LFPQLQRRCSHTEGQGTLPGIERVQASRHAQYNSTRALTAVHWTCLRVFSRMFMYLLNRVMVPYIFSEIKTDYRSSGSTSSLTPHSDAGTFVHLTHVNHVPAPLYQSCSQAEDYAPVCLQQGSFLTETWRSSKSCACVLVSTARHFRRMLMKQTASKYGQHLRLH
jgi:hypothetical protein